MGVLPDHCYEPPTLEKLDQRIKYLETLIEQGREEAASAWAQADETRGLLERLLGAFDRIEDAAGERADLFARRVASRMALFEAEEARFRAAQAKSKWWLKFGLGILIVNVVGVWLLR